MQRPPNAKKIIKPFMKNPYYFQMAVKTTVTDDGEVRVRGLASTPALDRYRDIVEPEAFTAALKQYMKNPVLLRSHDQDRPVGVVESTKVTDKGLTIEAVIKDAEMAEQVKAGLFKAFSIGYIPLKTEIRNKDNEPLGEGDSMWDYNNIRVIKQLDLVEISVVSTPANPGALFTLAKSLKEFTNKLAFKAFDLEAKDTDGIPENEVANPEAPADEQVEEEQVDETVETEESTNESTDESVESEEEKTEEATEETEDEAGEADENEDEAEEKSTESQEEAGNSDETSEAESAEGDEKSTEEASADAEPSEEEEDSEDESEGKAIIVTKDVAELFPSLKAVGALREPEGDEKAHDISKGVLDLMRKLHDALVAENNRANEEQKRATDLQAKLDATPEKKAIASHRQFGAESTETKAEDADGKAETKAEREERTKRFLSLFKR